MISLECENITLWVNSNEERIEISNININFNKYREFDRYMEITERDNFTIRIPIIDYTFVKEGDLFAIHIETHVNQEEKLFKVLHAIDFTGTH